MFKLLPINENSIFLIDALMLLVRYGGIIFSENKNPAAIFLDGVKSGFVRAIGAVKNDELFGIVVFYDFDYFAKDKFICYMYGAGKRGFAKKLEAGFAVIFQSLKEQGCIAVRFETQKINLPMRFMAKRLGFNKVGIFKCGNINFGKVSENIIYEKIL